MAWLTGPLAAADGDADQPRFASTSMRRC
jgi:hypothetical protein